MRVNYVTPAEEAMPAVRYRMKLPGEYIGDYEISMVPVEADLHVFSKPYHTNQFLLDAYLHMAEKTTFVLDVCDDIFERDGPAPEYMRKMMLMADSVTCSTDLLKDRIKEITNIDAIVISDPYEFSEEEPKDISYPRVMWFGSEPSFDTLQNVRCSYPVEIVCKNSERVKRNRNYLHFDHTITEWSIENMKKAFKRNNVVIIPSKDRRTKSHNYMTKSPNRVVESIRQGLAVVAAPLPSYQQFDDFITLDWNIENGLNNLKPITKEAQKYVRDNFDISVIGEKWKTLFDSILAAEQKSLMVG